ncbi:MAG TPA: zinc-dependent metalloprotease [Egibacteraceae bacterium]|nr:zinc-dependent metalloprotease [Egibacteraceae bacterium]
MSEEFGGFDPRMFENVPLFRELAKVMSWSGGPVNWDLAVQTAVGIATPQGDDPVSERETEELAQAVSVAELWLDQVTELPAVEGPVRAFSRQEWARLAAAPEGLGLYVEPIARGMTGALGEQLPEELRTMSGPLEQAMQSMGAMLYGVQIGTVAGHLADQLLGTYDLGVPTVDARTVGTVGAGAASFASDWSFEEMEVRYWIALSECAHRRQFAGVAWLREHLRGLIQRFAEEADPAASGLLDQLQGLGLDPSDPAALQEALQGEDAFRIEPSSAQRAVLDQLQALVVFLQAWADTVVRAAAADKLTALPRIEETIRRRRAAKGPGERFLAQLLGIDLGARDFRQAQAFCDAIIAARGQSGLDRVWAGPDRLPSAAELAEPSRWLVRMAAAELETGAE